ncbi:septum formation inhibitor Maf [Maribacter sp. 2210JD10-5]|uniref:septum formation inhibitor Maf n=1 Tax=Maribacter sp. 2210JD10-5 TaxID=3386272 RepID=UPI0039BD3E29
MFKKWLKLELTVVVFAALCSFNQSCKEAEVAKSNDIAMASEDEDIKTPKKHLSQEFKDYWYAGKAEITSYTLEQARYGEIREGNAVLIYVTEPFLPGKQVKADRSNPKNIPVLKLNATKKYLTGIYPYSIMSSSFYPVHDNEHAIKVSFSAQEWCGHVYAQLNNKNDFQIQSRSYFESEADEDFSIKKAVLENEIWNKIRIDPNNLPVGAIEIVPSLEYARLSHKKLAPYSAKAALTDNGNMSTYEISYPELNRTLKINFTKKFPHTIESWEETYKDGFGPNAKVLTSKGTKNKSIKTAYWGQNSNSDLYLRDSLGL